MSLPVTGSRLVAEDAAKYVADMKRGADANKQFGESAKTGSVGANALSVAIGNVLSAGLLKVADGLVRTGKAGVEAFAGSVRGAAELEAQMSGVAAVLGGTSDDLAQLKQLTLDLGIDPTLKVSSVEAAEAIEMLAKNGLDMQTIMDGAAKATIALSNATGGDFARAADIMTDAAAIFKFEGSEMIDVVAGITAVTTSSKFSLNDYALALANGGDVAAKAGVPFDDFNTAIAAISPSFSSGMTAGTSFKNFLLRLVPNSDAAKDAMKELNLVTDEGKSIFFDAQGNLRDMADIAGILQEALSGLSAEQRTQALRTIFGNDAMGAAIALAEVGRERFIELGDAMAQVDPQAAAAMRMDNFAGAMEILDGVIESVSLQVGDKFLPALTKLARIAAEFIEKNADEFIAFFERGAELVDIFASELSSGATPAEAFRAALEKIADPATLAKWDDYVATGKELVGTLRDLGAWASQSGPAITSTLMGIGAALVTFKTITTVAAGVAAFTAAWTAGAAAFTAAGGGLAGLVAVLGGPLVVVAGAAAIAIGGLVKVTADLKQQSGEFGAQIDNQMESLRATSQATGDYSQEAAKLATALDLSSTGLGIFTGKSDDVREAITNLIVEVGDFSGSNEDLQLSLQGVFGESVQVSNNMITLNGHMIEATGLVFQMAKAHDESAKSAEMLAAKTGELGTAVSDQTEATGNNVQAMFEGAMAMAAFAEAQFSAVTGTDASTAAIWAEQAALQAEVEAQEAAAEAARRAAEIRQEVTAVINSAVASQSSIVRTLIGAVQELEAAETSLAAAPWDAEMIARAESAREGVTSAFDAIAESHRQMALDIYVRNAELGGSFDESAANIAVALGLMTQEEADFRLEAVRTAEAVGELSDQMIQTFLEDGTISRAEAEQLAQAIQEIEDASGMADMLLEQLADGGMSSAEDAAADMTAATDDAATSFDELGAVGAQSAVDIRTAYLGEDWGAVGASVSEGVRGGIESRAGEIAAAAAAAISAAVGAAKQAAQATSPSRRTMNEVGIPFAEGIAVGITAATPVVVASVVDMFDTLSGVSKDGVDRWSDTTSAGIADSMEEFVGLSARGTQEWSDIVVSGFQAGAAQVDVVTDEWAREWSDVIVRGIKDGVDGVDFAIDDGVSRWKTTLTEGLSTWAGTLEDGLDGLFDLAGPFASLGNTAVQRFQKSVLDPLTERSGQMEKRVGDLQKRIAGEIGRGDFFTGGGTYAELLQLSRGELEGGTYRSVMAAKELLDIYREQGEVNEQIRKEQERIAELQRAQADLQFLQQQLEIVSLIEEHGLSTDLLGGLQVGIDADAGAVIDAMTNVIRAIIEAAQAEAGIASPSKVFRGVAGQIVAGLVEGFALGEPAVSDEMRQLISGAERAALQTPATPAQTFSAVTNRIDRSVNVQIENNSGGRPVDDIDQLAFLWATYAT